MRLTRKMVFAVLAALLIVGILMTGCRRREPARTANGAFPGRIAIITNDVSQNEEEFRSAEFLVERYGAENVTHVTWPTNFMAEQEQMVTTVARIAADREVRALIINQAVPGTNPAVDRLLELRDDIFIVYASPQENPPDVSRRANLILNTNDIARGTAIARQAYAQGARVIVHYSFPRHMSNVLLASRRDLIRAESERLGIEFIDATAPDPTGDAGTPGTQQFILEDVPRRIALHGVDTAFFATNCAMQIPLIYRVLTGGAIFPEPCCPSPTHGFPSALAIDAAGRGADIPFMVTEITRIVEERGMQGRLSTWPAPASMTWTVAGAEYAIKWIRGEVPREGIDINALRQVISSYIYEVTGAYVDAEITNFVDPATGEEFPNYKLILMGHLTF